MVTLTNPTSTVIEVEPGSGLTGMTDGPSGITLADKTNQRRTEFCHEPSGYLRGLGSLTGPPSTDYAPTGKYSLPPGASVQLWGFYAAPPADVTTVDVEIGGLDKVEPTPITS